MAVVTINDGQLRGAKTKTKNGHEFYEFLGVPYAKPPIGDLRFKSPQPVEPWTTIRDATDVSPNNVCCQVELMSRQLVGTEDCLYLNVFTPKLPEHGSKPLPVMFVIHGGGFVGGNGILKNAGGPDYLLEHDVVVVNINYRLNVFGFLSLDIPEAAGNMGLKDQVKALEWVQRNITEFGGDKNNVTIIGPSAGAASVEYLVISPRARGLFHKAIALSGSTLNHWAINYNPKDFLLSFLEQLQYMGSTEDHLAIHKFLVSIPSETLAMSSFKTAQSSDANRLFLGFVPTIEKDFGNDDAFLTTKPYEIIEEGKFNRVPMIKGYCNKEGYMSGAFIPNAIKKLVETKKFTNHWAYKLDAVDDASYDDQLAAIYLDNDKCGDDDTFAIDFFTDYDIGAGVWVAGKKMASVGVPVYFYIFSYDGKANFVKQLFKAEHREGAAHNDDVGYIWSMDIINFEDEADMLMKNRLTKMYTDFAKTGKPTSSCNDLIPINWPNYTIENNVYLNMDKEFSLEQEPKQMVLYEESYEKYKK